MKIFYFALISFLSSSLSVFSQDYYNLFINDGSNSRYIEASKVQGDSLYLCGLYNGSAQDAFIVNFNLVTEEIEWIISTNAGFNQSLSALDVKGNMLVTGGYTNAPDGLVQKAKVFSYDISGNEIWQKTFDAGNVTYLKILNDNSIIVVCAHNNGGSIIRIAADGTTLWSKTFIEAIPTNSCAIQEIPGGIIYAGRSTDSPSIHGGTDVMVFKLDMLGNTVWSKVYGSVRDEEPLNTLFVNEDKILIVGMHDDANPGLNYDNLFLMLDTNGNILQVETYGTPNEDFSYDVTSNSEGEFVMAAKSYVIGSNDEGMSLKLDSNLNLVWSRIYSGIYGDILFDIENYQDGYILTGINQSSNGAGFFQYDGWISRITQNGIDGCLSSPISVVNNTPILSVVDFPLTAGTVSEINEPMTLNMSYIDIDTACFNSCDFDFEYSVYNPLCNGDSDGAISFHPIGYNGTFVYSMSPNFGNNNGIDSIYNLVGGTYNLTLRDSIGCSSTHSIVIDDPSPIVANFIITPNTASAVQNCNGTITVNATGGTPTYTYLWNDAAGFSTSSFLDKLCDDSYCVRITDANGCFLDTCTLVTVGFDDLWLSENSINLYPNPAKDILSVLIEGNYMGDFTLEICDMTGKVIEQFCIHKESQLINFPMDLSGFKNGNYVIKIVTNEKGILMQQFVKI
ncbi:MAG: T9SS type A sorting domain-containing protein [Crocinitomicaceae bacterium]|nr:T9SS type A sorting domain-containing protein [Crocinitomicaceae bacterium]MBK8928031.1 T9SS type A sorting domain-containing protein [Crocinitomicaceae bacterium]